MKIAAVILAAGLGTRMKSDKAKVLHELAGKALVCYPVELALGLKAERIIVVVGHQADLVRSLLNERYQDRVETVVQQQQLGTAHAVLMAKNALKGFNGHVLILSGDVPLLEKRTVSGLIGACRRKNSSFGLISANLEDATGYGRVIRSKDGNVRYVIEHRDADPSELAVNEANMGIYVAERTFLFKGLAKIGSDNDQGEYYLPDLVRMAADSGQAVQVVKTTEQESSGINNRIQLARMEKTLRLNIAEKWMWSGVSIIDPATTYIDAEVKIKRDTIIEPNVHLRGAVKIGSNCRIETGSVIEDSIVRDRVHIKPYTVVEQSVVDSEAILGPFSHLRPLSHIGQGCHIGNFVETKKTTLKKGAKANHLSYLGDAEIGSKTNIGAGTITCYYDGYSKYRTKIGNEVLVGSDTQLIAPVTVPDRVVLGAGTTLTGDVKAPKGSLVLSRPEVTVVPGYRDMLEQRSGVLKKTKGKKVKKTKGRA